MLFVAFTVLAARKAVKFAILPPLTSKPPHSDETPIKSANHFIVFFRFL